MPNNIVDAMTPLKQPSCPWHQSMANEKACTGHQAMANEKASAKIDQASAPNCALMVSRLPCVEGTDSSPKVLNDFIKSE
jgi:hypothetical protein